MYYTVMETIYSVEEIASILKIQPFTVRKMFRENKLSGFKIGKAWRITDSQLQTHIIQLQESAQFAYQRAPSRPDVAEKSFSPTDQELQDPNPSPPLQKAGTPSYRSLVLITGNLLIFSETPGEEVYLDGESKGQTTLSLLDVAEGEHRLQVGDVIDTIMVHADIEMRVRSAGGELNITTRSSAPTWWTPTGEENDAKLVVQMENNSKLTGAILVLLAGENAEATSRIFADYEFANYENETSITNIQLLEARELNKEKFSCRIHLLETKAQSSSTDR
jgi:excisionase family DNA binding protein